MPSKRLLAALLLASAALFRLYLFLQIGYTADDALITFRYANNLVDGKGFVYNAGEKVLGTTTPLNTLLLAALGEFGIGPFWAAFVIATAADGVTGWVLLQIFAGAPSGNQADPSPGASGLPMLFSWIPSFVFLFSPDALQWCLSGMETEVSIALLFAAVFCSSRDKWTPAFLIGSLAILNRVDGVAVLVGLMACHVIRRGRLPVVPLAGSILMLAPWSLFAFAYFGSPLPNSAAAKWALAEHPALSSGIQILFQGFLHVHTFGAPLLLLALVGTWSIFRERRQWMLLPIWTWGYALSYALASGPMHAWYYAPFYAAYIPLLFFGLLRILGNRRSLAAAACAFSLIIVLLLSYYRLHDLRKIQAHLASINREVGLWIKQNTPEEAVLAVKDIGYMGYYSGRRVLDLAGLISPECIPYRAKGDFLGPIRRFHPEYFAFSAGQARSLKLEESDLMNLYKAVKTITYETGSYTIYQRL